MNVKKVGPSLGMQIVVNGRSIGLRVKLAKAARLGFVAYAAGSLLAGVGLAMDENVSGAVTAAINTLVGGFASHFANQAVIAFKGMEHAFGELTKIKAEQWRARGFPPGTNMSSADGFTEVNERIDIPHD